MSAAERQHGYRQRQSRAAIDGIGAEAESSRVTLLAMLGKCLATLEDASATRQHGPARNAADRVLRELQRRYAVGGGSLRHRK